MEWWEWIAWVVAVTTGLYGAWRAWATDRRVRRVTAPWTLQPIGTKRDGHVLRSQLPYVARSVVVEPAAEKSMLIQSWDEPIDIPPTEAREVHALVFYSATSSDVVVRWRTPLRRRRSSRLPLPPSPYEPFKD